MVRFVLGAGTPGSRLDAPVRAESQQGMHDPDRVSVEAYPASCNRRVFTVGAGAWIAAMVGNAREAWASTRSRIVELETALNGRIGVFGIQGENHTLLKYREQERFAMCSTFKAPLAGFVLDDIAKGRLRADRLVSFEKIELVSYSPVLEAQRKAGLPALSVLGLCRATVAISDNTAANLLLELIGGPAGFTARAKKLDATTRLDRTEPELNENRAGDPRDTTTPEGMAKLLRAMLYGGGVAPQAAMQLRAMMIDCRTGAARLRAGLPDNITVGDKTGTSGNGVFGDIAFVDSGSDDPVVITAYVDAPKATLAEGNGAHREVGKWLTEAMRARAKAASR